MKNSKGISLIALIITIIVIVILAAVVVTTSINTPKSANFAVFCSNIGEAQQSVSLAYADRYATKAAISGGTVDSANIYATIAANTTTNVEATTPATEKDVSAVSSSITGLKAGTSKCYEVTATNTIVSAVSSLMTVNTNSKVYITDQGEVFVYPGFANTDNHNYITSKLYY